MPFEIGEYYSREQIQKELGGEIQSYLPQSKGRIVAGCFGRKLNPKAPLEVQAGNLPKVTKKAETLAAQTNRCIPVFLKGTASQTYLAIWHYQGLYELSELVADATLIADAEQRSGRKGMLSYLLRFREVKIMATDKR